MRHPEQCKLSVKCAHFIHDEEDQPQNDNFRRRVFHSSYRAITVSNIMAMWSAVLWLRNEKGRHFRPVFGAESTDGSFSISWRESW